MFVSTMTFSKSHHLSKLKICLALTKLKRLAFIFYHCSTAGQKAVGKTWIIQISIKQKLLGLKLIRQKLLDKHWSDKCLFVNWTKISQTNLVCKKLIGQMPAEINVVRTNVNQAHISQTHISETNVVWTNIDHKKLDTDYFFIYSWSTQRRVHRCQRRHR
jgi:hypothetical protein